MGEVIQFPGRKRIQTTDAKPAEQKPADAAAELPKPIPTKEEGVLLMRDPTKMREAMHRAIEVRRHISGIVGGKAAVNKNIASRLEVIRSMTPNDLADTLLESTSADWSNKPAFYWAVTRKFVDSQRPYMGPSEPKTAPSNDPDQD